MLEPFKKISVIDETRGISSLNPVNSLNIATFIVSPTGPVERTTVVSQSDLINKYCSGSSFSATDNVTIHHIGALVADTPVDVIRVDTSVLREGKTSTGLRYITDKDFNPISTYEIVGINNVIESKLKAPNVTYVAQDGVTYVFYSGPASSDFSEDVTPVQVLDEYGREIDITDVDTFMRNLNRFIVLATANSDDVGGVRGVANSSAIMSSGFETSHLINEKKSTVAEATVVRSSAIPVGNINYISANDNVIIGGYTFYYEGDGTMDISGFANPIPVSTSLNDPTHMDPGMFLVGVQNALLQKGDIQSPMGLSGNVVIDITSDPNTNPLTSVTMSDNLKLYVSVIMKYNELEQVTGASITFLPSDKLLESAWIRLTYVDGTSPIFWFNYNSSVIPESLIGESHRVYSIETKTPQRFAIGIADLIDNGSLTAYDMNYHATEIDLVYSSENQPGLAVSSTSQNFWISTLSNNYVRVAYDTGDSALNAQTYGNIYVNIADYSFYNGDASAISGLKTIRIKVSPDALSIPDFLDAVVSAASNYFKISRVSGGLFLATDSEEGYEISATDGLLQIDSEGKPVIIYGNQESITDRFAVIARFPSNANNFKFNYSKNSDESYSLTLNYNGNSSTVDISFDPNAVDGYGTSIYYTKVNEGTGASPYFYIVDIGGTGDYDRYSSDSYGGNFVSPSPSAADIVNAMNKYKDFTDKYYDFIWDAGYADPVVAKGCASVADALKATYVLSFPFSYKKKSQFIDFRESTGIDSYRGYVVGPSFRQAVIGTFLSPLSESLTFLRAKVSNFNGVSTEFSPVYGPVKGKVISPNLTVKFSKEDREELLDYQINMVIPNSTGYQVNMNVTMQSANSYLSEEQNVQMINTVAHVCDEYADNLISEVNDATLWNRVVSELTERLRARMIANKNPTLTNFRVIMNEELNPREVVESRQAVFQVWVQVSPTVAYVLGYVKVMRLGSF